jgi:hypothetical protein
MVVHQKMKTCPACYTTLGHISKGDHINLEKTYLQTNAYCNTIHNSQAIQSAYVPNKNKWIKKL